MQTGPIRDEPELEERLSDPTPEVADALSRLQGDLLLLGVGGKMGPSPAQMSRRAFDLAGKSNRVLGVSRFSQEGLAERLAGLGVEPIRCDLLDRHAVAALPHVVGPWEAW